MLRRALEVKFPDVDWRVFKEEIIAMGHAVSTCLQPGVGQCTGYLFSVHMR